MELIDTRLFNTALNLRASVLLADAQVADQLEGARRVRELLSEREAVLLSKWPKKNLSTLSPPSSTLSFTCETKAKKKCKNKKVNSRKQSFPSVKPAKESPSVKPAKESTTEEELKEDQGSEAFQLIQERSPRFQKIEIKEDAMRVLEDLDSPIHLLPSIRGNSPLSIAVKANTIRIPSKDLFAPMPGYPTYLEPMRSRKKAPKKRKQQ